MADFRPVVEPILITRGDSPIIPVNVTSGGSALDISAGFAFTLTVNASDDPADDTGALFQLTGTIADGPAGLVTFQPSVVQSLQTPDKYNYDVQMVSATTGTRTILKGDFTIDPDITRTP